MATTTSIVLHFFLLCLFLFSASSASNNDFPESGFITLPVKKDPATLQYYTSIGIGTPQHDTNLAIDLSSEFLWYDCNTRYNSSSYKPVPCNSQKCPQNSPCNNCNGFPTKPGCTNNTCGLRITNPFVANTVFRGDIGQDLLHISDLKVPRSFVSGCANSDKFTTPLLTGLAKGTRGILGLADSQLSLTIQISSSYNIIPKFTLCLPNSHKEETGKIFIGQRSTAADVFSSIAFAAGSSGYFVNVKSIDVDGTVVNFNRSVLFHDGNGNGGTKFSTLNSPYTVLHPSIYKPFVSDFVKKSSARGIKRVKSVAPFGACFDAKTIGRSEGGQAVPDIHLAFDGRSGEVKYEILGHNSMIEVKKNVLCLAFVDGGKQAKNGIVLGGHQLEDRLLEFDLSTSILRFSIPLMITGTT